jgi:hypothetical protein
VVEDQQADGDRTQLGQDGGKGVVVDLEDVGQRGDVWVA